MSTTKSRIREAKKRLKEIKPKKGGTLLMLLTVGRVRPIFGVYQEKHVSYEGKEVLVFTDGCESGVESTIYLDTLESIRVPSLDEVAALLNNSQHVVADILDMARRASDILRIRS